MKALFSTLYLANQLEKALKNKGFNTIEFNGNEWNLNRIDKKHIVIVADYVREERPERHSLNVDRAQWVRLLQFLKLLPEQPIVLEVDFWDSFDVRIRLSQFVADF